MRSFVQCFMFDSQFRGDSLGRLDRAAALEHAHPSQQRLLIGAKQRIAPAQRLVQGLLMGQLVAALRARGRQALADLRQHLVRRKQVAIGGHQLDRQRDAAKADAQLGHRRSVLGGERKIGLNHLRAHQKERDRRVAHQPIERRQPRRVGQRQRRHREDLLAGKPELGLAGQQDLQPRRRGQQALDQRGGLDQLLEIIEDQQRLARGRWACSASTSGRSPVSLSSSACAIAEATSEAEPTGASGTK